MWCHLILLVPAAGLGLFWFLPWPLASVLYVAGVFPSLLIAWVGWRALQTPPAMGREAMVGALGVAVTDLSPSGQVRHDSVLWSARATEPVRQGEHVRIDAVEGLRLRVRPERR
jgi:membrane-bound serine protease (ClpP class)